MAELEWPITHPGAADIPSAAHTLFPHRQGLNRGGYTPAVPLILELQRKWLEVGGKRKFARPCSMTPAAGGQLPLAIPLLASMPPQGASPFLSPACATMRT